MPEYRCYFLTQDGHFAAREDFTAPNDEQAIERARSLYLRRDPPHHGFELWENRRIVCRESG
jgi:1,2-phenylacetyl-CoA epoxidase PaaB subunit